MKTLNLAGLLVKGHDLVKQYRPAPTDEIEAIIDQTFSLMQSDLPTDHKRFIEFDIGKGTIKLQFGLDRQTGDLEVYRDVHRALYRSLEQSGFERDLTRVGRMAVAQYRKETDPRTTRPNVLWDFARYVNKENRKTAIIDVYDPSP